MAAAHAAASRLRVDLAARGVGALGRAARVGNDHGQPARDRLGDARGRTSRTGSRAPGRRRRPGTGRGARGPCSKPAKRTPGRRAAFEPRSFGSVPEEDEDGLVPGAHPLERVEHDVPPLLDREAADADEQRGALAGAAEELSPSRLVSRAAGRNVRPSTPKGTWTTSRTPAARSRAACTRAADEGRVERREQRAHALPEGRADRRAATGDPSACARAGSTYVPTWSACQKAVRTGATRPQATTAAIARYGEWASRTSGRSGRARAHGSCRTDRASGSCGRTGGRGPAMRITRAHPAPGRRERSSRHLHPAGPARSPCGRDRAGTESDLWTSDGFEPLRPFPNRIR